MFSFVRNEVLAGLVAHFKNSRPKEVKFRNDIEGLRGLSVLGVIFFHANIPIFQNGHLGVDIFFIISGYLISRTIFTDLKNHSFDLKHFYFRRARRILPALFLMLFAVGLFGWLFMLPNAMESLSESIFAASTFSANFYFFLTAGYFDTASNLKPLLHTWSLAVEEQFYFFAPLTLLAFHVASKQKRLLLGILTAICLVGAASLSIFLGPDFAFYMLTSRVFELLLGVLIAKFEPLKGRTLIKRDKSASYFAPNLGLILIVFAFAWPTKDTLGEAVVLMAALFGTSIIIWFCDPNKKASLFLTHWTITCIGAISFSLYLWHQPIFAFYRLIFGSQPTLAVTTILISLTFIISIGSYLFVEAPARRISFANKNKFVITFIFLGLLLVLFGALGHFSRGFEARFPENIQKFLAPKQSQEWKCPKFIIRSNSGDKIGEGCEFGAVGSAKTVILFGDSHAGSLVDELDKPLKDLGYRGLRIGLSDDRCENPIAGVVRRSTRDVSNLSYCLAAFKELLEFGSKEADIAIILNRWTYRLFPIPGIIDTLGFKNPKLGLDEPKYREYVSTSGPGELSVDEDAKKKALRNYLKAFTTNFQKVILVYPIPELGFDPIKEVHRAWRSSVELSNISDLKLQVSFDAYLKRNRFIIDFFNNFSYPNIIKVRPSSVLCERKVERSCDAIGKNGLYYFDNNHLSNAGAQLVVEAIYTKLQKN